MGYGGATRSHWKFTLATTTIERQDIDTKVTWQEPCSKNCSIAHTSWDTGRTRATRPCWEAQIFRPQCTRRRQVLGTCAKGLYTYHGYKLSWRTDQPAIPVVNWAGENGNSMSVGPTTFWQRPICNNMCQTDVSSHTWRGHMVGQACPHNH
jgi:hypothetical protein